MVELIKTHKVNSIFALAPVMGAILAVALVIL